MNKRIKKQLKDANIDLEKSEVAQLNNILNVLPKSLLKDINLFEIAVLQFYVDAGYSLPLAEKILTYYCAKGGEEKASACELLKRAKEIKFQEDPKFSRRTKLFDNRRGALEFMYNAFGESKQKGLIGAFMSFYELLSNYILTNNKIDLTKHNELKKTFDLAYDADFSFGPKHEAALLFLIKNNALPNIEKLRKRFDYDWLGQNTTASADTDAAAPSAAITPNTKKTPTSDKNKTAAVASAATGDKKYRQSPFGILVSLVRPKLYKAAYEDLKAQQHPLLIKMEKTKKTFEDLLKERDPEANKVLDAARQDAADRQGSNVEFEYSMINKLTDIQNQSNPLQESKSKLDLLIMKEYERFLNEQNETEEQKRQRLLRKAMEQFGNTKTDKKKAPRIKKDQKISAENAKKAADELNKNLQNIQTNSPEELSILLQAFVYGFAAFASWKITRKLPLAYERFIPKIFLAGKGAKFARDGYKLYAKSTKEQQMLIDLSKKLPQESRQAFNQTVKEIIKAEENFWIAITDKASSLDIRKRSTLNSFAEYIKGKFSELARKQNQLLDDLKKGLDELFKPGTKDRLNSAERAAAEEFIILISNQTNSLTTALSSVRSWDVIKQGSAGILKFLYSLSGWRTWIGGTKKVAYFQDLKREWGLRSLRTLQPFNRTISKIEDAASARFLDALPLGGSKRFPEGFNLYGTFVNYTEWISAVKITKVVMIPILETLNSAFDDYVFAPSEYEGISKWLKNYTLEMLRNFYDGDKQKAQEALQNMGSVLESIDKFLKKVGLKSIMKLFIIQDILEDLVKFSYGISTDDPLGYLTTKMKETADDVAKKASRTGEAVAKTAESVGQIAQEELDKEFKGAAAASIDSLIKNGKKTEQAFESLFNFIYLINIIDPGDGVGEFTKIRKLSNNLAKSMSTFLVKMDKVLKEDKLNPQRAAICGIIEKAHNNARERINKFNKNVEIETSKFTDDSFNLEDISVKDKENILRDIVLNLNKTENTSLNPIFDAALKIKEQMFRQYILAADDFEALGRPLASAYDIKMGPDGVPVDSKGNEVEYQDGIPYNAETGDPIPTKAEKLGFGATNSLYEILSGLNDIRAFQRDLSLTSINRKIKRFIKGDVTAEFLLGHLPSIEFANETFFKSNFDPDYYEYVKSLTNYFKEIDCSDKIGALGRRNKIAFEPDAEPTPEEIRLLASYAQHLTLLCAAAKKENDSVSKEKLSPEAKNRKKLKTLSYIDYFKNADKSIAENAQNYLRELLAAYLEKEAFDQEIADAIKEQAGGPSAADLSLPLNILRNGFLTRTKLAEGKINDIKKKLNCSTK